MIPAHIPVKKNGNLIAAIMLLPEILLILIPGNVNKKLKTFSCKTK